MYQVFAKSEEKPNGHIFSEWGGLSQTYESDYRIYLVFEKDEIGVGEEVTAFVYGTLLRIPSGTWEYAKYGDVNWDDWSDEPRKEEWYKEAFKVAKPAKKEFEDLINKGYTLYCKL